MPDPTPTAPEPSRGPDRAGNPTPGPAGARAPDPARGLFETLLVADGRPIRITAHLDRLAGSTRELFGQGLPAGLDEAIADAARPLALGRIRVDLLPEGSDPDAAGDEPRPPGEGRDRAPAALRFEIAAGPIDPAIFFPAKENGADLRTVSHPEWAGAHKWADRDWLEEVEAELGETVPLILAGDEVLEAGRANIFLVADGALATPPADGRILPGTARAATLALAADLGIPAEERPLHLADLHSADDLFLTSSLRGIRPVRSLDGEPLGPTDPVVERLATALRRRWLDAESAHGG
ncbi:MAG TPA: aminotransferase class IV [Solirubrobacterales bacterium]|nr:aminotransferase class IV [Solirubrobacterales bacterium]